MDIIKDRTKEDTDFAYDNQSSSELLKGALNYQDLNRIESNIQNITNLLDSIGYESNLNIKTNWTESDLLYVDEADRIRNNLKYLVIKFVDLGFLPQIDGGDYLDYVEVNNWENTIYMLNEVFLQYGKQNLYCGAYFCGE